jgi:periplasmic copper chaperone A
MMKVNRIPVPAGSAVQLKRCGLHVMLLDLPVEVKEGDEFTLALLFEKSGKKENKVNCPVPDIEGNPKEAVANKIFTSLTGRRIHPLLPLS